jgi:hypothetical protein
MPEGLNGRLGLQNADRVRKLLHSPNKEQGKNYSAKAWKLIEQKNLQKILKFAVEILISDESAENV